MSVSVSKPTSFGDDSTFNSNSSPIINYSSDSTVESTTKTIVKESNNPTAPTCQVHAPPWPTIIISVLGAMVVIYIAIAPNVNDDRRLFGVVLLALWTAVWALILWVLWKECHRSATWWLLLIPVIMMALFFVVIIILNIGAT